MFRQSGNGLKRRPHREYLDTGYNNKPRKLAWLARAILTMLFVTVVLLLLFMSELAAASETNMNFPQVAMQDVSEGSLLLKSENSHDYRQVPLVKTDVDIHVSGMILRCHVKQEFRNTSNAWVEGIYVFPLPEKAAVDHMRMHVGERVLEGLIKEKQEARKIYQQAKREGKKAALTEQQRPNLFTNSVANIGPGETVVVEIEYQQTLRYDQGHFSFHFPMAMTPRYIPGRPVKENIAVSGTGWAADTDQVPDASKITPPVYTGPGKINPVSIRVDLDAGFPLQSVTSPYHAISRQTLDAGHVLIRLKHQQVPADRDFRLVWTPQAGHGPRAAVFNETVKGDNYHLVMVMPPSQDGFDNQPLAREVIFVIDTSGSMAGTSMEQARHALSMALDRLRLHDSFNVIQFNSITSSLFSQPRMASEANIARAQDYVQGLMANGGTEMAPALKLALQGQEDTASIRQVVFLTDGSVGNESALFDMISKRLGNSRLFTIGIGSAPNHYFMSKAAEYGRGTFTYIGKVNEVKQKMAALFGKLESAVMTNITVKYENNVPVETWPRRIPDLYAGEPLLLAVRSSDTIKHITINGTRALAPWQASLDLQQSAQAPGVGVYWARSKIAALMDGLHEGVTKETVRADVIKVALAHHLVSQYTSLVAVDVTPTRPDREILVKKAVPVNLPHGQQYEKIFGRLPQTATPAELNMLMGLGLLLLAMFMWIYRQGINQKEMC